MLPAHSAIRAIAAAITEPTQPIIPSMPSIRFSELIAPRSQKAVNGMEKIPSGTFTPKKSRFWIAPLSKITMATATIWPTSLCRPRKTNRSSARPSAHRTAAAPSNPGSDTAEVRNHSAASAERRRAAASATQIAAKIANPPINGTGFACVLRRPSGTSNRSTRRATHISGGTRTRHTANASPAGIRSIDIGANLNGGRPGTIEIDTLLVRNILFRRDGSINGRMLADPEIGGPGAAEATLGECAYQHAG